MVENEEGLRKLYGDDAVDPSGNQSDGVKNKQSKQISPDNSGDSSSNNDNSGGSPSNDNSDSSDEGIGRGGTIPVKPGNPLYDAVKRGGGYVVTEDGEVTGGPDGDGTRRTEEERTSGGRSERSGAKPEQSKQDSGRTFQATSRVQSLRERFGDAIVREEVTARDRIVGDSVDIDDVRRTGRSRTLVEQGRRQRDNEAGEAFGGRGEIERELRSAASDFRGGVDKVASEVGDIARLGGSTFAASSPVTAEDPAVAAGSDNTGSGTESAATGTVQGIGEVLNVPQFGVTAIEAGEVANAGISSAPVTGGSSEESQDFVDRVSAAAAAQGADTVEAAKENPINFIGQVAGGAVVGGVASRAVRGSGGSSPDIDSTGGSVRQDNLGSRGTGPLVDPDEVQQPGGRPTKPDRGNPIEPPAAGETDIFGAPIETNRDLPLRDQIVESGSLRDFLDDESGTLEFRSQRQETGDTAEFDPSRSEVLEGSPRDRISQDVADRSRQQRTQNSGTFDGNIDPVGRDRGPERRQTRAQRSEVLREDDLPDGGDGIGTIGPIAGGAGVGAVERTREAQEPGLDVGVGPDDRLDVTPGQDSDVTPDVGPDTDQPVRSDTDQPVRPDTDQPPVFDFDQPPRSRESPPLLRRRTPGPDPDPTFRTPDTRRPLRRPDRDDDDDDQLDLFGGSGGLMADSGAVSGAATGFVAETLVGFGEGGLNIEAAQAADSADSGFLSTRAESDSSEGFEAARGLFSFGGDA